jgi:hypothetical protein
MPTTYELSTALDWRSPEPEPPRLSQREERAALGETLGLPPHSKP